MRKFHAVIFLLLLSWVCSAQQTDSTAVDDEDDEGVLVRPDNSGPLKLGIKIGAGYSTMTGSELQHPSGGLLLDGTLYLRYRFKPRFAVQGELGASFRGCNFNNGPGEYSLIKTYYLDMPVMLLYALNEKANSNLAIGLQYAYLLNSTIFMSSTSVPEPDAPGLKAYDLMAVLGTQFYTPFVGFQILAKYGLTDIDNGLLGAKTKPVYKGKDIHHFTIEFNFIF